MKLTDEQIDNVRLSLRGKEYTIFDFARAVEAEVLRLNGGGGEAVAHWNRGEGFSHCDVQRLDAAAVNGTAPLYAAPQPQQAAPGAVLEGWQLVPVEPTDVMKTRGRTENNEHGRSVAEACYRAMLSAAPKPQGE